MKRHLLLLFMLTSLLVGCGSVSTAQQSAGQVSTIPTATIAPTVTIPTVTGEVPVTPEPALGSYYLYTSNTLVIFLDFADSSVYRVDTTTRSNAYGQPCLNISYENDMQYSQQGETLTIQALYIYHAPFIINPDGTLTTHEVDESTGQIVTETFYSSSIDAYNRVLKQMEAQLAPC